MLSAITDVVTAITVVSQEATIVVTTVLSTVVTTVLSTVVTAIVTALHNISSYCHLYDPLHFYYLFTPLHTSVNLLTIPQLSQ